MASTYSVGGLVSGMDTNSIISQLMTIERQPETRLQNQVTALQSQKSALRELRTQMLSLRTSVQNFRLLNVFDQFKTPSSDETILKATASGTNPVTGSYTINVTQLASATVATSGSALGRAIDPAANLNSSGISAEIAAGTFTINGQSFTIDPATQSLNTILGQINASGAGVTATYDAVSDKVTFTNTAAGNANLINFGATGDTSNFLEAMNVNLATQTTGTGGSTTVSSTANLGAVDPSAKLNAANLAGGAVTSGTFSVNGASIAVDSTVDSLADVIQRINDSDAQVMATYDTASDTVRFIAKTPGSRTIGFTPGTSNFLDVAHLTTATQTAGNDAQFTVNGGAVQTRNTNEVADAVSDVTLQFLSTGTSTVTVTADTDSIVKNVQDFVKAFNDSVDKIEELTAKGGTLENDASIREIEFTLRNTIFSQITGGTGSYSSLVELGITTGDSFDAGSTAHLQLDEDTLREALRSDPSSVEAVFHNTGGTGIVDQLYGYTDGITNISGFLNDRTKANGSIDQEIQRLNDNITQVEERVLQKQDRLKKQFAQMEQLLEQFQSQGSSLTNLSASLQNLSSA